GKYIIEKEENIASEIKVSKKEYTVRKNDTLWKIAEKHLGSGHRWKYLYEFNKDKIKDANKLKPGMIIIIPME
ncbi:MAG TPA: LysM peptidoglycan-binding domain-containing protein, partial [Firmicutes bacterium]|nr:LysM peptidoglycan-binding domain-containing protein [Bacillota bacterium]